MFLISHRGNVVGKDTQLENSPAYIDAAISKGYDVEIDLSVINDTFLLGHDTPTHKVNLYWLTKRSDKLWIHAKNIAALEFLSGKPLHYFWHEEDMVTLTSRGVIWAHSGKQPIKNSVILLPELKSEVITPGCAGICSDFIAYYAK